jgi:hypothetical protein
VSTAGSPDSNLRERRARVRAALAAQPHPAALDAAPEEADSDLLGLAALS